MRKFLFVLALLIFVSCANEPSRILDKGVSLELAQLRKKQVSNVLYELHFRIPENIEEAILSDLTLNFDVSTTEHDVLLDFNVDSKNLKSVSINGQATEINHQNEHVVLDKSKLTIGRNKIEIPFDAGETSLNRNEEFLYTLLVPDRASTLFPCFDQPDIKAKYNLTVTTPRDWQVLAGGKLKKWVSKDDTVTRSYATSDLMSTYLFSFVAGKFSEAKQNPGAFQMRFLYRENNQEKIDESVDEVFKIHQNAIDYLEDYTAYKFPFQKMDFAAIPPFQYGGMEHVGAIQYRQSSLFLDKNATQNRKLGRAKLIAHETSHMWFGDLVTMRWFNDVWMKEVFANFMADKIVNPVYPDINHGLSFMMSHYPRAYNEDRTKGTNPIRQELGNLKNAGSLYGRIIYNKAPIMVRQLEYFLGEELFQIGIQEYIKTYANDNADWSELVDILDSKSTKNVKAWSDVWVNSSGRPIFYEEVETNEKGSITKFVLHQKAEDGSEKVWPQSFKIHLMDQRGYEKIIGIKNIGKSFDLTEAMKGFRPGQILYNTNGFGYGVFPIYKDQLDTYKTIKDEVSRGYQYINLYENMLNGAVSAKRTFGVFLDGLEAEKNELIANYLSGRLNRIYWVYLSKQERDAVQLELENRIFALLNSNISANLKRTVFGLYQNVAISEKGQTNLFGIWNKDIQIKDLFLNTNNYSSLALRLALYEHPKADEVLLAQKERIQNSDRLARFNWLLPSVSKDEKTRDEFMISLFEPKNREKESWVQSALSNLHHPLRQKSGVRHLKKVLEELEEVQLTGDIFFPKGWLASSIGNYSSKEAYDILQQFLAENPDLKPSLRLKLLQTTDDLERAQTIKGN
ncbi:MAG: peptidase M1 [Flavobacteriaceae bacterium]|nr:peptidase M1 [Flavobacteriaceae bacterium]|tara:strand:- start:19416 stop:21974 length:2559 start_codon:yes stop_codon:yes gene_type:complete